jgi:tetratricopeptide (TPR) repeat protein
VDTAALAIDVRLELRNVLVLIGAIEPAGELLETARRLAERLGDPVRLGRVWAQTSSHYWWTGRSGDALVAAETAARLAAETGDRALAVAAALVRGYAYQGMGDYREAQRVLDALFAAPVPEPDRYAEILPVISARAQALLSILHCGDFDEALARAADFFARTEALDHRHLMIHARWCFAEVHLHRGEGAEAIPRLGEALELFLDRADSWNYETLLGALGYAEVLAGRVDEGLQHMHEALAGYRSRIGYARLLARLAEASLIGGRVDDARRFAARCLDDTRAHGERGYEAWALRMLGEVTARGGADEAAAAAGYFLEALAIAEPRDMRPIVAHCRFGLGRLAGGGDDLREAVALYRAMGMRRWREEAEAFTPTR